MSEGNNGEALYCVMRDNRPKWIKLEELQRWDRATYHGRVIHFQRAEEGKLVFSQPNFKGYGQAKESYFDPTTFSPDSNGHIRDSQWDKAREDRGIVRTVSQRQDYIGGSSVKA